MVKNASRNDAPPRMIRRKIMIWRGFAPTLSRSRQAVHPSATAGCPIIQTMVEYPTTKLDSQRLHTRSPVFQPAHHATPRPSAKATRSSQEEVQFSEVMVGAICRGLCETTLLHFDVP